uniref:Uncharacterized protein n=1 Tax=viral metagenome TaxID=1070528 RepID=A0A6H1ZSS5_9ZZZZ
MNEIETLKKEVALLHKCAVITGVILIGLMFTLFLIALTGCATPGERLLTKINDDVNYQAPQGKFGQCRTTAEQKVKILTDMGIKAEVVHCEARDKYSWDHAGVKVYLDGQEWFLDNGKIMDVVWEYSEVKKACYDFILP